MHVTSIQLRKQLYVITTRKIHCEVLCIIYYIMQINQCAKRTALKQPARGANRDKR